MTSPLTLDISQTPRVPLSRLVKVELRKMVDTRAGMWLMIAMGAISVVAVTIFGFAGKDDEITFGNFMGFTGAPQSYLLPILGILLVTQEWGQRTGMVTFTLEPHRNRVLIAKVVSALLIGLAAITIAIAAAALATVVFGGSFDDFAMMDILKFAIFEATRVMMGLVFGLLFLSSAAAIVTSFLLPLAFSIVANVWSLLQDKAPWIDLSTALGPLVDVGNLTGREWAQYAVTTTVWVVIPFVIGFWRVLRAEVK
jgi:ABC-type transport system involved in multi-copper enzyme maturation permease subunit